MEIFAVWIYFTFVRSNRSVQKFDKLQLRNVRIFWFCFIIIIITLIAYRYIRLIQTGRSGCVELQETFAIYILNTSLDSLARNQLMHASCNISFLYAYCRNKFVLIFDWECTIFDSLIRSPRKSIELFDL